MKKNTQDLTPDLRLFSRTGNFILPMGKEIRTNFVNVSIIFNFGTL